MSFTVDIQMRCDQCGAVIAERRGLVGNERINCARWDMLREAAPLMIMTTQQLRRRTKHLCHECADQPPRAVSFETQMKGTKP